MQSLRVLHVALRRKIELILLSRLIIINLKTCVKNKKHMIKWERIKEETVELKVNEININQ